MLGVSAGAPRCRRRAVRGTCRPMSRTRRRRRCPSRDIAQSQRPGRSGYVPAVEYRTRAPRVRRCGTTASLSRTQAIRPCTRSSPRRRRARPRDVADATASGSDGMATGWMARRSRRRPWVPARVAVATRSGLQARRGERATVEAVHGIPPNWRYYPCRYAQPASWSYDGFRMSAYVVTRGHRSTRPRVKRAACAGWLIDVTGRAHSHPAIRRGRRGSDWSWARNHRRTPTRKPRRTNRKRTLLLPLAHVGASSPAAAHQSTVAPATFTRHGGPDGEAPASEAPASEAPMSGFPATAAAAGDIVVGGHEAGCLDLPHGAKKLRRLGPGRHAEGAPFIPTVARRTDAFASLPAKAPVASARGPRGRRRSSSPRRT